MKTTRKGTGKGAGAEPWCCIVQWPTRVLGVGQDIQAACGSARRYLPVTISQHLPQISWGVRDGDLRWAYLSPELAAKARPGMKKDSTVVIDMLRTRPGWIIERPTEEAS